MNSVWPGAGEMRRAVRAASLIRAAALPFVMFCAGAGADAQTPGAAAAVYGLPRVQPESVGLSAALLARIAPAMQAHVDTGRAAGVLVAVARRGGLVYFETFGRADIERDVPLAPDAVFYIYSLTKPVTAVAVMQLVEQGKLRLDDPVARFIPSFAAARVYESGAAATPTTVPLQRPITVQDLLTHTAGLSYGFGAAPADTIMAGFDLFRATRTVAGMADSIAALPLVLQPGTRYRYGPGLEVAARIVEVVSGRPFDRYLEQEVFRPLRMHSTGFRVTPALAPRVATVYERGADGRLQRATPLDVFDPGARLLCGGCGLLSTAGDFLRFAQMLANRGELDGARILTSESVALLSRNLLPPALTPISSTLMGSASGQGLGVAVQLADASPQNPSAPGTFGWAGAASTFLWIDPAHELVGLVWVHVLPSAVGIFNETKRLVYPALLR